VSDDGGLEDDLSDDLMRLGGSEPGREPRFTVRLRDSAPLRWVSVALLIAGGSISFTDLWWLGLALGVVGLGLLWVDNERLRRRLGLRDG
jgi:hypothetical protein